MKKVAIVQSNYIPWKGYFDMIAAVDEFILYDDMQYTRRDWRNRNQIKTPQGVRWITVQVKVQGRYHQLIRETDLPQRTQRTRRIQGDSAFVTTLPGGTSTRHSGLPPLPPRESCCGRAR